MSVTSGMPTHGVVPALGNRFDSDAFQPLTARISRNSG